MIIENGEFTCAICGKHLKYDNLRVLRMRITTHLKEHKISLEDYLVKYDPDLEGKRPKCACGCGEDVHWSKGGWRWNTYAADSHVGKENSEYGKEIKKRMLEAKKYTFNREEYYTSHYDIESIKESVADFLSKKYTLAELEDKYGLDKRTLEKAWFELNLITIEQYQEVIRHNKFSVSAKKRSEKLYLSDSVYAVLYSILETNPQKYTISKLIEEYNKNTTEKITKHPSVLYDQLKNIYGDIIDVYLVKGFHSSEEYSFYKILSFYFPKSTIKLGYMIRYGTESKKYYIYDLCIDDKILIEYDSSGEYHSSEEVLATDEEKEKFAKNKGFKFIRLTKDDILDINLLNKVKQWISDLKK